MTFLNCKCEIVSCGQYSCPPDCKREIHINCACPKEKKIPLIEIAFIKGQRDKTGFVGPHQMGLPDFPEHHRQVKQQTRQEAETRRDSQFKEKSEASYQQGKLPDAVEGLYNDDNDVVPAEPICLRCPVLPGQKARVQYFRFK